MGGDNGRLLSNIYVIVDVRYKYALGKRDPRSKVNILADTYVTHLFQLSNCFTF